jgi:hypothetical protein
MFTQFGNEQSRLAPGPSGAIEQYLSIKWGVTLL